MISKLLSLYRFISPSWQVLFSEYRVDFRPRYGHGLPAHEALHRIINGNRAAYGEFLQVILSNRSMLQEIRPAKDGGGNDTAPYWNNGFLPGLDIAALYSMIGCHKPETYLEIGSGNSTKVARKAIRDFRLETRIVSIDPLPRADIDALSDEVIRSPLESMEDKGIFAGLKPGDIVFIDNSHRCLPNSDVTVCFLEVIPALAKGVIVQIHDIYLPFDYPQFMADRFYSEQYLLACWLMAAGDKLEVLLPNYFISEDRELSSVIAPLWEHPNLRDAERHGGSFWFRVNK